MACFICAFFCMQLMQQVFQANNLPVNERKSSFMIQVPFQGFGSYFQSGNRCFEFMGDIINDGMQDFNLFLLFYELVNGDNIKNRNTGKQGYTALTRLIVRYTQTFTL